MFKLLKNLRARSLRPIRGPLEWMRAAGIVVLVLSCIATVRPVFGEEIIIGHRNQKATIGDFGFSATNGGNTSRLNLFAVGGRIDPQNGQCEVKAGDLWQYFNSQGVTTMDSLVLFLDVGEMDRASSMTLESLEVSIIGSKDASGTGNNQVISFLSMDSDGDNSLVIPGYDTNRMKPEARLELPLGFNFMERFSESSTEILLVNVSYNGDVSLNPVISIEGKQHLFTSPSMIILGSFVIFWASVFWILKRMTLPQRPKKLLVIDEEHATIPARDTKKAAPAA